MLQFAVGFVITPRHKYIRFRGTGTGIFMYRVHRWN